MLQYIVKNSAIMLMLISTIEFITILHDHKKKVHKWDIVKLLRYFYDCDKKSKKIVNNDEIMITFMNTIEFTIIQHIYKKNRHKVKIDKFI